MDDLGALLMILGVLAAGMVARQWYRRRVAAKLADRLLADVVRDKDSFRR